MISRSATDARPEHRPLWSLIVVGAAVIAIVIAAVIGVRGLMQDPVGATVNGTTTLHGTFQPVACAANCAQGFVQAGARSVFVLLPSSCPVPASGSVVTIEGRIDGGAGRATYRATGCAVSGS